MFLLFWGTQYKILEKNIEPEWFSEPVELTILEVVMPEAPLPEGAPSYGWPAANPSNLSRLKVHRQDMFK